MWDELISIHLKGTFYATRECLKVMYEQEYGRIINTASQLAYKGVQVFHITQQPKVQSFIYQITLS
ncbi:MAG: hypothetical protein Ct9H90mP13_03470 [Pseudomonadota bacterium]|nr:MAG: hypothetical protein Ct9H90mP13_03470 [Pseudomonadota bacterium]